MRRFRVQRSGAVALGLVLLGATVWLLTAPAQLGGSARYVITHGDSMAPSLQGGDLAVVRPAEEYRVGQVVAYRSRLLNSVVLHRIIGRDGRRYVLRGDNNDFLDRERPGREALIGSLWVRVPKGGRVLGLFSSRALVGAASAAAALLVFLGVGRRRRRGDRREGAGRPARKSDRAMTNQPAPLGGRPTTLIVAVLCAAVFLGLALLSFTAPASRVATLKSDYLEKAHFTYRAYAPPGPVYRDGIVRTGDPIFLRLVQRVQIDIDYRLAGAVPREVAGVHDVVLRLTGPTGWSRTLRLAPRRRFTGNHAGRQVILDLSYVRSLIRRVEALTGAAAGGAYTLAVTPRFRISGSVEGRSLASEFRPALSFQLDSLQLRPGSGPGASENAEGGFSPSRRRSIATVGAAPNRLGVKGLGLPVRTVRRLALAGFVLALACALVAGLREHRRPRDGTARVHRRYGHLIVPIAGISHSPARPPIDVAGMDTLAKLADRSGRLILHHHHENVDTYVVDDEGTLYRYTLAAAHATSTASPAVAH